MQIWRWSAMWSENADLVLASHVGRDCIFRLGSDVGREIVDLSVVNDMGRQCRFNGGQQCEERMQI